MRPTEELIHEHEIIAHVLTGAEKAAHSILSTHAVDIDRVQNIIDFSRHFTDQCHHKKEEKHLFVRLVERGMSKEHGPIGVMLNEHQMGRDIIRKMEVALTEYQSGKKEAGDSVGQWILKYVQLLRNHIMKENNILFPMADGILTTEDQQHLEMAFNEVEMKEMGEGVHEKYHQLAHKIGQ